ncbi:hypothetical protein J2X65_005398 [Ancylobacter sp. 3268]|nr:hypothetical protein [Ancylobacter sp. 3268]
MEVELWLFEQKDQRARCRLVRGLLPGKWSSVK